MTTTPTETDELLAALDWPRRPFTFADEPGEHDPCYVVMPDGASLAVNHHAGPGVDIARAKFIVDACNAALDAYRTRAAAPVGEGARNDSYEHHIRALLFAARTTGDVAGPNEYLKGVCERAEAFLISVASAWSLSPEASEKFARTLANPAPPNEALRDLADDYRARLPQPPPPSAMEVPMDQLAAKRQARQQNDMVLNRIKGVPAQQSDHKAEDSAQAAPPQPGLSAEVRERLERATSWPCKIVESVVMCEVQEADLSRALAHIDALEVENKVLSAQVEYAEECTEKALARAQAAERRLEEAQRRLAPMADQLYSGWGANLQAHEVRAMAGTVAKTAIALLAGGE